MKLFPLPAEAPAACLYTSIFFLQARIPFDPELWADFSSMLSQRTGFLALLLLFQVIKSNQMYWHNTSSSITEYFSSEQKYYYLNKVHLDFFFFWRLYLGLFVWFFFFWGKMVIILKTFCLPHRAKTGLCFSSCDTEVIYVVKVKLQLRT